MTIGPLIKVAFIVDAEMDVVEAIVSTLLNDDELMGLISDVVYLTAPEKATYPLVVIGDPISRPAYTIGSGQDLEKTFLHIESVTEDTDESGAYSASKAILKRIFDILQDKDEGLVADDSGDTICLRRMDSLPGFKEARSNGEMRLRRGHEWEIVSEIF